MLNVKSLNGTKTKYHTFNGNFLNTEYFQIKYLELHHNMRYTHISYRGYIVL